jgi:hypothetical protein
MNFLSSEKVDQDEVFILERYVTFFSENDANITQTWGECMALIVVSSPLSIAISSFVCLGIMPFLKGVRQDTSDVKIDCGNKRTDDSESTISRSITE